MRKPVLILLLTGCVLLSGCSSILDREYSSVEEHSSKYWESEAAGTLRAESYQDIVNDLLILIGKHTESATVRLYNYEDDMTVADTLEQATTEVQKETPMGAYAVEYITCTSQSQRSYYEVSVQISYRRSAEQIQAVVNATSTLALPSLLDTALSAGKAELTVRIGYWDSNPAGIDAIVEQVRTDRGLTPDDPAWKVSYYPNSGTVGLIEFVFSS